VPSLMIDSSGGLMKRLPVSIMDVAISMHHVCSEGGRNSVGGMPLRFIVPRNIISNIMTYRDKHDDTLTDPQ